MIADSTSYKPDTLFEVWRESLPELYKRNPEKTIPFIVAETTLCLHRIPREDSKKLLKEFVENGFLRLITFRGFRMIK